MVVDLQTPDDVTHSDAEDNTNDSTNDDVANPEAEPAPASIKPNDYVAVKLSGRRHKDFWYMAMVNIIPILCNQLVNGGSDIYRDQREHLCRQFGQSIADLNAT